MTLTKLLLRPFHSRQDEQGKESDDGWSNRWSCHVTQLLSPHFKQFLCSSVTLVVAALSVYLLV